MVSMNVGSRDRGLTRVGARGYFMANSHIGHDCHVGDDVTFANSVALGGHSQFEDWRHFRRPGGGAAICRVGKGAMIGGLTYGCPVAAGGFSQSFDVVYTSLGFAVREPIACLQGCTRQKEVPRCVVRMARSSDLESCNALCRRVHGFERDREVADALERGGAKVVIRGGRITGYTSGLAFFGHSVGETNIDLQA